MQKKKEDIVVYSPDSLLSTFSKGRMVLWMGVATLIHVVFIALLSLGYIRDAWIDPEGAKVRQEQAEAQKAVELQKLAGRQSVKPVTAPKPHTGVTPSVATAGSDQEKLEKTKGTPTGKRLTAVAASNEVPRPSSDLGLSIEDTNIR